MAKSEVPVVKDLQGNAPGPGDGSKVVAPGSWKDRPGRGSIPTLGLSRNSSGTRKAGLEARKCTWAKCTVIGGGKSTLGHGGKVHSGCLV